MLLRTFASLLLLASCNTFSCPQNLDETFPIEKNDIELPRLSDIESAIRDASVKVLTPSGHGSGTYFILRGETFVLTAEHVVSRFSKVKISSSKGTLEGTVILVDVKYDIAIIRVGELGIKPIYWNAKNKIPGVGTKVFYTAFPSRHDRISIHGEVAGFEGFPDNFSVIVHGHGWPGSSGGGVFDRKGQIIGIISMIDVGKINGPNYAKQGIPNIQWVKPVLLIDKKMLIEALKN